MDTWPQNDGGSIVYNPLGFQVSTVCFCDLGHVLDKPPVSLKPPIDIVDIYIYKDDPLISGLNQED